MREREREENLVLEIINKAKCNNLWHFRCTSNST